MPYYTTEEVSAPWSDSFGLMLLFSSTAQAWQWVRVFSMWRNLFWWPAYVSRLRHVLHVRHCNRLKLASSILHISVLLLNMSWLFIHDLCFPFKPIPTHGLHFQRTRAWWSTYCRCAAVCWLQSPVAPSDRQNKQLNKCMLELQTPAWN